jgi:hypothetical protein
MRAFTEVTVACDEPWHSPGRVDAHPPRHTLPTAGPRSPDEQAALNFGYARADADEPWRQPPDDPGPLDNRAALSRDHELLARPRVAGFRVDMAYSLVKGDPDRAATAELWAALSGWLHETYPDAVLLPESDIEAPVDERWFHDRSRGGKSFPSSPAPFGHRHGGPPFRVGDDSELIHQSSGPR